MDGLKDQIDARTSQRDLANDRLVVSTEEIEQLRKKITELEEEIKQGATPPEVHVTASNILFSLAEIQKANTATLGISGIGNKLGFYVASPPIDPNAIQSSLKRSS